METELVYLDHDNAIDLVLLAGPRGAQAPVSLAAVTRMVLVLGATTLDSAVLGYGAGQAFDPTVSGSYAGASVDVLRLRLGAVDIPAGKYRARLTLFDPSHPNGLVWTEELPVVVTS